MDPLFVVSSFANSYLPSMTLSPIQKGVYRIRETVNARKMREIQMQRKETELHFLLLSQWVLDLMPKRVSGIEGSLLLSFLRRSRACDKLGILNFSSLEF